MREAFDFIIVGAGSAGCVLADRLSADDGQRRVLLLEAGGPDRHPLVQMPLGWLSLVRSGRFGWGITNEPEESTDNRVWPLPRGKLLGGTSSINGMMYSRGCAGDYDAWAAAGLAGWSYAEVLPYFRRAETNWRGASVYHGAEGPLNVARHPVVEPLYRKAVEAGAALGYPELDDFNGPEAEGFGIPDFTMKSGRRHSTAQAYLRPALRRPNLTVVTGAHFARVALERGRAVAVDYWRGGALHQARAAGEVILCGGALASPQMLMLSGIGPADALKSAGVVPRVDLPGVGSNLQDHPMVSCAFAAAQPVTFEAELRADRLALSTLAWSLRGRGALTSMPMTVQAFLRLCQPDGDWPDVQFQLSHVSMLAEPWHPFWRKGAGHQFTAAALQLQPDGRGEVRLRSDDPMDLPRVRLGLLQTEADQCAAREMVRFIRRFFATPAASSLVAAEIMPGDAVQSDADLDAFIRATLISGSHQTSTCAMGTGPEAVVDAELRVRGVEGLRVVDASVMPRVPRGNTNAPVIMIAEKASDMVLGRPPPAAEPRQPTRAAPRPLSAATAP